MVLIVQSCLKLLLQWNLELTKCQGTGEIGLLISRFFFIHYLITGLKNVVHYTEEFVKSRFHSTSFLKI